MKGPKMTGVTTRAKPSKPHVTRPIGEGKPRPDPVPHFKTKEIGTGITSGDGRPSVKQGLPAGKPAPKPA
jgi:hypothetical protein